MYPEYQSIILLEICFVNMVQPVACLISFSVVSFGQTFKILIGSDLSIFLPIDHTFACSRKKFCLTQNLLLRFLLEALQFYGFTFRSVIHFEIKLIFVDGMRCRQKFIFLFLYMGIQMLKDNLLKRLAFLVELPLQLLLKIN